MHARIYSRMLYLYLVCVCARMYVCICVYMCAYIFVARARMYGLVQCDVDDADVCVGT